jgi:hypothetical protein
MLLVLDGAGNFLIVNANGFMPIRSVQKLPHMKPRELKLISMDPLMLECESDEKRWVIDLDSNRVVSEVAIPRQMLLLAELGLQVADGNVIESL